jgi:catechol 2,3-dioxygenase-like lactoylglutathione lyase family enzyme
MSYKYEFTRLLVSNFKACFLFYRDVLGFQVGFGTENDTYADFTLGTVNISLFDKHKMSEAVGTSHLTAEVNAQDKICLVFAVENVDAICQQLKTRGIQLAVEPTDHADWGVRTAHFRDPDGNLIEINQPLQR